MNDITPSRIPPAHPAIWNPSLVKDAPMVALDYPIDCTDEARSLLDKAGIELPSRETVHEVANVLESMVRRFKAASKVADQGDAIRKARREPVGD